MGNTLKFLLEYNDYINNIEHSNSDLYIYNEIIKRTKFGRLAIVEGLIFTHPSDKSKNILLRRFPELKIEIETEGEIYVENQPPQELKKYLPIITNLGYFISKLTINGKEWIKEFDEKTKPIAFILEAKYDLEVLIPDKLYHCSPLKYKDKILKIGLIPKSNNKISNHPDRIYLTDNIDKSIKFGEYLGDEFCIYEIDGKCLSKLYSDVNLRNNGFYTLNNIQPKYIKIVKEFVK